MCGRFINTNKIKKLKNIFEISGDNNFNDDSISYNIAPSQSTHIIIQHKKLTIEQIDWGFQFIQKNTNIHKTIINSRLETITEKLIFKDSFNKRRCLIPANGYYEWTFQNNNKVPYFIEVPPQETIFFAGIWKYSNFKLNRKKTFSIITKSAHQLIQNIHNRMPVILSIEEAKNYIEEKNTNFLEKKFVSSLEEYLEFFQVSKFVNSPFNNSKECIKAIN